MLKGYIPTKEKTNDLIVQYFQFS